RGTVVDRACEISGAAVRPDVHEPKKKSAAGGPRHLEIDQCGERMTQVQIPVRTRGEAEDGSSHVSVRRSRDLLFRSSPRKRGSRATHSGLWIPTCAGMNGDLPHGELSLTYLKHAPRKGLRCHGVCRCCAALMFFIHTEADLDHAIARVVDADPRFGAVLSRAGRPPLRRRPDGFSGLASIVVSQQLSTASAKAIWARLNQALDPLDHAAVLRARTAKLARAGLSASEDSPLQGDAKSRRRG